MYFYLTLTTYGECTVLMGLWSPSKLPPTRKVHHTLGVVLSLQLPDEGQGLAVYAGQWVGGGVANRIVAAPGKVLVQQTLLIGHQVPKPSSGLGDDSEAVYIVLRAPPLERNLRGLSGGGWIASRFRRPDGWQLVMRDTVTEGRSNVVGENATELGGCSPVLCRVFSISADTLDASWTYRHPPLDEVDQRWCPIATATASRYALRYMPYELCQHSPAWVIDATRLFPAIRLL